jgi:hypothetical protein
MGACGLNLAIASTVSIAVAVRLLYKINGSAIMHGAVGQVDSPSIGIDLCFS